MFRIAIELPFNVLLLHKQKFRSEKAANRFIHKHYQRFPAFGVYSRDFVEGWSGNTFQFPAHWKR